MHLDIGLPLLSESEQLRRAFWQNHNFKTLDPHEQTHRSQPQRQSPDPKRHPNNANNHTEPNHCTQSRDQNSSPDGARHTHDNHDMRTEHDHSCSNTECKDRSSENGSETFECNDTSGQPKAQDEPSQQVNNSPLGCSNRPRRTSRAQWDRSTEDSSFL